MIDEEIRRPGYQDIRRSEYREIRKLKIRRSDCRITGDLEIREIL
jgi:hypothetical protein